MAAIDNILHQIDVFISKYYKNQILKGLFWFIGILLGMLLIFSFLEYIGWFSKSIRFVLFLIWVLSSGFVLIQYFCIPLFQLFQIRSGLTRERAAAIIGDFFPEIGDKLVNTLQLSNHSFIDGSSLDLVEASIDQKSKTFKLVQFTNAIDKKKTFSYLKFVIPIICVFLGVSILKPEMLLDSSQRIFKYNQVFEKPAPFKFNLSGFKKEYVEGDLIEFEMTMSGSEIPERIYLISKKGKELLKPSKQNTFAVDLGKASNSNDFYFEGDGYTSTNFTYSVIKKPSLIKFSANVIYPNCLSKEAEVFNNALDLVLPEGSYITWKGLTKNAHSVDFVLNDSLTNFKSADFSKSLRVFTNQSAAVYLKDNKNVIYDSIRFSINVIRDAYPTIYLSEYADSLNIYKKVFTGKVADDNGLKSLRFHYSISNSSGKRNEVISVKNVQGINDQFEFAVDFLREKIKEEDKIEYYFSVSDNDCVHGGKTTLSTKFSIKVPSKEDLQKQREEVQENVQSSLAGIQNKLFSFQDALNKLKKDISSSKQMDWKLQNQSKKLMEDYNSLMEDVKQAKKELDQNAKEFDKLSKEEKDLLEKQALLDELMKQLMDDELKGLLEKLQDLMQKNDKQDINKTMDEMNKSSEEMNRNLDRSIDNLKKMQVDEKIDKLENTLKDLSKEQRKLEEEIDKKKTPDNSDLEKQNEINDKFDKAKEDLNELMEKNDDLKRPFELPELNDKMDGVSEDLKNASDKMLKNKKASSQSQKSAADRMEEMADQLDKAQKKSKEEQQGEDIELLRQILKYLVTLSYDQEDVMNKFKKINASDPSFKTLSKRQANIIESFLPVSDSLLKLASRQPKIAKFVDDEIRTIQTNHTLSLGDIQERRSSLLGMHQQYAMTSLNNLALMLNEALQQMQKEMQDMKDGDGSCDNPGAKGKPKPGSGEGMQSMKDKLKKQLEQMEKGESEGKSGKDKEGSEGSGGLGNKEIAKMAAEQSMIRKQLEDLKSKLKGGSSGASGLDDVMKQLEKQEEDLVNKRFDKNVVNRQREILTRLLESEKAIEERDWSDERESKEGKNVDGSNLILINQYNKDKLKQIEEIHYIDPKYQKYYKEKAVEFLNR